MIIKVLEWLIKHCRHNVIRLAWSAKEYTRGMRPVWPFSATHKFERWNVHLLTDFAPQYGKLKHFILRTMPDLAVETWPL